MLSNLDGDKLDFSQVTIVPNTNRTGAMNDMGEVRRSTNDGVKAYCDRCAIALIWDEAYGWFCPECGHCFGVSV